MKRQMLLCEVARQLRYEARVSGTSVATAILLVVAAILLCTRLQGLDAKSIALPLAAALLIEGAFYVGITYLWCGRFRPGAEALGVTALFAIRVLVSAAAMAGAQVSAGHRPDLAWEKVLAPVWQSWMTASAFAVVALAMVRDMLLPAGEAEAQRAARDTAPSQPTAARTLFDSAPAEAGDDSDAQSLAVGSSLFQVIEPRRVAAAPPQLEAMPQVEGWAAVPASVVAEQLPPGAQVTSEELLIPLSLIMPRLRTGEVRIPLAELEEVCLPLGLDEQEASVELPLRLIVPQIPDEALELGDAQPPSWLAVEAPLEDIFFAKV